MHDSAVIEETGLTRERPCWIAACCSPGTLQSSACSVLSSGAGSAPLRWPCPGRSRAWSGSGCLSLGSCPRQDKMSNIQKFWSEIELAVFRVLVRTQPESQLHVNDCQHVRIRHQRAAFVHYSKARNRKQREGQWGTAWVVVYPYILYSAPVLCWSFAISYIHTVCAFLSVSRRKAA